MDFPKPQFAGAKEPVANSGSNDDPFAGTSPLAPPSQPSRPSLPQRPAHFQGPPMGQMGPPQPLPMAAPQQQAPPPFNMQEMNAILQEVAQLGQALSEQNQQIM